MRQAPARPGAPPEGSGTHRSRPRASGPLAGLGVTAVLLLGCGASPPSAVRPVPRVSFEPTEPQEETAVETAVELPLPEDDVPPIDFPTCQQARDGNVETLDLAKRSTAPPDVPASEYSAVLGRGTYLDPCGVSRSAAVTVCAAVVEGKAVGISVTLSPHNQRIINCVIEAIQQLSFPSHPRMDIATSKFEPGG
jgi:hypothetical protein